MVGCRGLRLPVVVTQVRGLREQLKRNSEIHAMSKVGAHESSEIERMEGHVKGCDKRGERKKLF